MDKINIKGDEYYIYQQLKKLNLVTDRFEAEKLVRFLIENNKVLGDDENVECKTELNNFKPQPGVFYCLTSSYNYHINVKISTITLAALILDLALTKGLATALVSLCGQTGTAIVKLNEMNGEKCIVKQTAFSKDRIGDENILEKFNGKCCNSTFNCAYNKDGMCICNKQRISEIYEELTNKNIFKKIGVKYKYQW